MFGLAVLAKGLVPVALAAPLLLGRHVRDWLRWRVLLRVLSGCAAVVRAVLLAEWLGIHPRLLCSASLFTRHFQRAMHVQPVWFYLPVWWQAFCPGHRCWD